MSDFAYDPDKVLDEKIAHHVLISTFENGVEQRRNKWSSPLREFHLTFVNRTQAEMEAARDFILDTSVGPYASFTWTNMNDSVEYTVRVKEQSFSFVRKAYQVYDFELSLIQVKT